MLFTSYNTFDLFQSRSGPGLEHYRQVVDVIRGLYGALGIMRRIDAIRVTRQVVPALRSHHVTDTELSRRASDHLPVTVDYAPERVTG